MPKRTPLDWEDLERELHAAGVSPGESRRALGGRLDLVADFGDRTVQEAVVRDHRRVSRR